MTTSLSSKLQNPAKIEKDRNEICINKDLFVFLHENGE